MPYYMRATNAGRTREVEKWQRPGKPQILVDAAGNPVELPPLKPSAEDITRINRANALRKLRQSLNDNFGPDDIWVAWTYRKDTKITHAEALTHYPKLIADIRKLYAAEAIPLRYIAVTEQRRNKRPHHHTVLPGIALKKLRALWLHGHINVRPLDDTGQYHRLAVYIFEHTDTPDRVGHRWRCSQGMTRPEPSKTKAINAKQWRVFIPKGWMLDTIVEPEQGVNPYTGIKYLRYTLIKIDPKRRC